MPAYTHSIPPQKHHPYKQRYQKSKRQLRQRREETDVPIAVTGKSNNSLAVPRTRKRRIIVDIIYCNSFLFHRYNNLLRLWIYRHRLRRDVLRLYGLNHGIIAGVYDCYSCEGEYLSCPGLSSQGVMARSRYAEA